MKQKLSQLQTPSLAGFIREKNLRGAISENGEDSAESIRAMLLLKKEVKPPVAYHANDKAGMLSRVINPLLGNLSAKQRIDNTGKQGCFPVLSIRCLADRLPFAWITTTRAARWKILKGNVHYEKDKDRTDRHWT